MPCPRPLPPIGAVLTQTSPRRLAAALTVLALTVGAAPALATETPAPPQRTSDGVEVTTYGTVQAFPYQQAEAEPVYFAVHAVQRVPSATVVYLSVGWPTEREPPDMIELTTRVTPDIRFIGGSSLLSTTIVLPGSSVTLETLPAEGLAGRNRAFTSEADAVPEQAGVMGVLYAVLPELPDGVDVVDVQVGFGGIVPDVPVGEGLLTPTVEGPVVPLGTGWPQVPPAELARLDQPELSVKPFRARTETIDGAVREAESADAVTIDIAADVLFAVDSATLSPQAAQRVAAVAADVTARAADGPLTVVGHTDSDGTDAYNDDLSRRRAQAVAAVLAPAAGGRQLAVEGRGEREPVAGNDTPEGKQKNRRVSISFPVEEGS